MRERSTQGARPHIGAPLCALALLGGMAAYAQTEAAAEVEVRTADPAFIHAFEDEGCATKGSVLVSTNPREAPAKARVPAAGKRIYLRATTANYTGGPARSGSPELLYAIEGNSCTRLVSFVPLPGRHYTFEQNGGSYACPMNVIEVETGFAPVDLRAHPVGKACALAR